MSTLTTALRALAAVLFLAAALPAAAQQGQQTQTRTQARGDLINPTAKAVQEDQMFEALTGRGGAIEGRVSIPDARSAALIKPGNPGWRDTHQNTMTWVIGFSFAGILAIILLFFLYRGRVKIDDGRAGVTITRFNGFERFAHWMTAVSFLLLAFTGLNLAIGKMAILPLVGPETFAALTQYGKYVHNYVAWPFMLGIVLIFLLWVRDNIPEKTDAKWFAKAGGLFVAHSHPPAKRFNGGQKVVFWSTVIGGAVLSVTGVILLFPALVGAPADWQLAQILHGVAAAGLIALMIGHIYIGSVGMEGAFDAMGSGEVDLNWAKEHHGLWVEEMQEKERRGPRGGVATPAE